MVPSLPLLSCESSVSVKENPDRKKKEKEKKRTPFTDVVINYLLQTLASICPFITEKRQNTYGIVV